MDRKEKKVEAQEHIQKHRTVYDPPRVTEVGAFGRITRGHDSVGVSDDGNGAAFTDEYPDDGRG